MTIALQNFTPTQAEAISRRKAFHAAIEQRAAEVAARKARLTSVEFVRRVTPPIKSLTPEAFPAEPDPPRFEPTIIWPAFVAPIKEVGYVPRVAEIQAAVCKYYGYITIRDLKSSDRTVAVVIPRHVAMYLTKALTDQSLPQIGRLFGKRDHSTALHGIRKIAGLLKTDANIAFDVASLFELITGVQQ